MFNHLGVIGMLGNVTSLKHLMFISQTVWTNFNSVCTNRHKPITMETVISPLLSYKHLLFLVASIKHASNKQFIFFFFLQKSKSWTWSPWKILKHGIFLIFLWETWWTEEDIIMAFGHNRHEHTQLQDFILLQIPFLSLFYSSNASLTKLIPWLLWSVCTLLNSSSGYYLFFSAGVL